MAVRLVGVDLPQSKRVEIALTYIYGIGLTTSKKILAETGVDPDIRVKVTCIARFLRTSSASWRSAAIAAFATAEACRSVVSARIPMLARARARASKSAARESRVRKHNG